MLSSHSRSPGTLVKQINAATPTGTLSLPLTELHTQLYRDLLACTTILRLPPLYVCLTDHADTGPFAPPLAPLSLSLPLSHSLALALPLDLAPPLPLDSPWTNEG